MRDYDKIKVESLSDYLETMSKSVFQAGISWKVVESKWPGIKAAFHAFDPKKISKMTIDDIDALLQDKRIIRNRHKVEAIVSNAQRLLELDEKYGGFRKYLRSFRSFDETAKDLKKQFKFLGDMGVYHFLWVIGENVPEWEAWEARHMARV